MVNRLRLSELINKRFRKRFGELANPRDYPLELKDIREFYIDMLEEEANNHDYETPDDDTTEKA